MRKIIVILIIFASLSLIAQKRTDLFFYDYVECYYLNDSTNPIIIYDSFKGNQITELEPLTEPFCWYKLAISDSKENWLKIENIIVLPSCENHILNMNIGKYKDKWVEAKDLKINLTEISENSGMSIKFYENPDKKSKIVFKTKDYFSPELLGVKGTWAKVKIKDKGKEYCGWIERKYQCSYPWTNCPIYE